MPVLRGRTISAEGLVMPLSSLVRIAFIAMIPMATEARADQSSTPPTSDKGSSKLTTLVGCIAATDAQEPQLTLADSKASTTYRLTGRDLREYIGRRVRIVGTASSSHVHIAGGLLPSPNAAAQAGAIDPGQAAAAGASSGVGTSPTSAAPAAEFRVRSVRPMAGSCPSP